MAESAPQVFRENEAPEYYQHPQPITTPLVSSSYTPVLDVTEKSDRTSSVIVLQRTTFWALIAALVVLFIATIGGSVGAALGTKAHDNNSKSVASTGSITACNNISNTTSTPIPSAAPSLVAQTSCPGSNQTVFNPTIYSDTSQSFLVECNVAYNSSQNIAQFMTYTLEDCITACAAYNFWNQNKTCTYAAYLLTGTAPGNCWLESGNLGSKLDPATGANTTYGVLQ